MKDISVKINSKTSRIRPQTFAIMRAIKTSKQVPLSFFHVQNCTFKLCVCVYANSYTSFKSLFREKVRTTNFTMSKTKKNIEKVGDDHNIEKLYKRDQNVKKGKDQNVKKS